MTQKPGARPVKPRRPDGDLVQSLMRALSLLEVLAEQPCRLTDLARRAQLPPSTTHRLLTTLEQKRFVRFDRDESLWSVSSHCFSVGASYLRGRNFLAEASPWIETLARRIGTTVNLGVREGGQLLLVAQAPGKQLSPAQPPGTNLPLHATAMGKVVLAATGDDKAEPIGGFMTAPLARITEHTIYDPAELARQLRGVRLDGIAFDNEESMSGRRCLAAPILNELGHCVAAVSLTATPADLTETAMTRMSAMLARTANEITIACGGHARQPVQSQ